MFYYYFRFCTTSFNNIDIELVPNNLKSLQKFIKRKSGKLEFWQNSVI